MKQMEKKCSDSKRQRQALWNQAKKYKPSTRAYEQYSKKAEEVDLDLEDDEQAVEQQQTDLTTNQGKRDKLDKRTCEEDISSPQGYSVASSSC